MNKYETLKKIYNLSIDSGATTPEKQSAKELLDKLLEKYGISIEEFEESVGTDSEVLRSFEFNGTLSYSEDLLRQVIFKVTNQTQVYYNPSVDNTIAIPCTESQEVEIKFLFDFYSQLFEKEFKYFFTAFIQKHQIYGDSSLGSSKSPYNFKEIHKILDIVKLLDTESPVIRIEERDSGN